MSSSTSYILIVFIHIIGLITSTTINGVSIDDAFARIMLDKHNALRNNLALYGIPSSNQPSATYMNKLHWDWALAATSQRYTNLCYSGHNYNVDGDFLNYFSNYATFDFDPDDLSLGENFLWYPRNYSRTVSSDAAERAREKWWDEHFDYNYYTGYSSGVTGHYTQMAWADTRYVGCGMTICNSGSWEYLYLICNYYPIGNFQGKKPYPNGSTCTECTQHAFDRTNGNCDASGAQDSGLCTGCMAPRYDMCQVDQLTNCDDLTNYGIDCPVESFCESGQYDYYCQYCPKTCGTCTNAQETAPKICTDGLDIDQSASTSSPTVATDSPTTAEPTINPTTAPTYINETVGVTDAPLWTWTCSSYRQCYQYSVVCPEGYHCNIVCNGYQSCLEAILTCPSGPYECNVMCEEEEACQWATIDGENAKELNVFASGTNAMSYVASKFPKSYDSSCYVNCAGDNACKRNEIQANNCDLTVEIDDSKYWNAALESTLIKCGTFKECTLICKGYKGCFWTEIVAYNSSLLTVIASGQYVLQGSFLRCPTNIVNGDECSITANGVYSGMFDYARIYAVKSFNDVSLFCDAENSVDINCGIRGPLMYCGINYNEECLGMYVEGSNGLLYDCNWNTSSTCNVGRITRSPITTIDSTTTSISDDTTTTLMDASTNDSSTTTITISTKSSETTKKEVTTETGTTTTDHVINSPDSTKTSEIILSILVIIFIMLL